MLSPSSIAWRRHAGREDRAGWHTAWLSRVPRQFARAAQRQYNALLFAERLDDGDARRAANYHVQEVRDHFDGLAGALDLTASDSEIRDTAKQIVEQILSMRRLHQGHDFEAFLNEITLFLAEREVYLSDSEDAGECATLLPKLGKRGVTHETVYKRLTDEGFWRRALFRTITRKGEAESIRAGLVNQKASLYVSDETLARFRTRRCRNRELLESLIAVNELGEKFTLAELADVSVSNPELRRAELMTRIVGFETIAKALGHAGLFLTITCPSRFHAFRKLKHGKVVQKNAAYGGATPRDAQRYLSGVFSRIRSQLLRRGIAPYGFRIAEPHHDGCPHWHLLLFVPQHQATEMVEVFRDHATKADREELARTGDDPRFRAIAIDWQRGSAAGYVSKYICKNIDGRKATGEPIGLNFDGVDTVTAAERVLAWASVWGIRQFQQIGVAPVTTWRQLRRLATISGLEISSEVIQRAAAAADAGDWAEFVMVLGGIGLSLDDLPIRLACEQRTNRYGEDSSVRTFGLVDVEQGELVRTHLHEWTVEFGSSERSDPWTRVNNCTPARGGTPRWSLPDGNRGFGPDRAFESHPLGGVT